MGQPEEPEASAGEMFHQSIMSQSSDDSLLLSSSSSTQKSQESSENATTCSSRSNQSTQGTPLCHRSSNSNPYVVSSHCKLCTNGYELGEEDLQKLAVHSPDYIRWKKTTRKVKIQRNAKGSLGFRYRDVKGELTGDMFTMIIGVFQDGPAFRQLNVGDCILSANGQPMHNTPGITLQSVVSVNKSKPVDLIIQGPEKMICRRKTNRSQHKKQERSVTCGGGQASVPSQMLARSDSKMSTNLSDKSDSGSKGVFERLQALIEPGCLSRLNALMPRVPCLRVLISGSEAETLATSLLRGAGKTQLQVTDFGVCYRAFVSKTGSEFTLDAPYVDRKEMNVELLESVAYKDKNPDGLVNQVELEVMALKSNPFSTYCQHILATAHSIFIVQFRGQDFINDRQSVLLYIQRRLNKIHTYASDKAPIYLVMTVEDDFPVEQLTIIGQCLHRQFDRAFVNQLQYNAATNCPCFTAVQTHPSEQLNDLSVPLGDLGREISLEENSEQCRFLYSKDTRSLDVCYFAKSNAPTSPVNQGSRFDLSELRDHLAQVAFQQRFILDRYPFVFLLYCEQVQQLKVNNLHYAYKARIKTCNGIKSEEELGRLLRFLHNSGEIICADFLEYKSSNDVIPFKVVSNNVLLDRQHLITATKRLTTVPIRSQQQDPSLHNSIRHWDDLGEKFTASSVFLEYLLGNDSESASILTTLSLMNLVHCLEPPHSQAVPTYMVPYFLPCKASHQLDYYRNPHLYNLCVDFHGSIPDGFFMLGLAQLKRKAFETRGTWSVDSCTSAHLSLANDCEIHLECDEIRSVINVSARCSVTYQHQELLHLLSGIFHKLKPVKSDLHITIGPPCPLPPHQCKERVREPGRIHVIDMVDGRAPVPLWCGKVRVDIYAEVDRWLTKAVDVIQVSAPSTDPVSVSRHTHITKLPPTLFNWLCNKLNAPPVGRDWQGLAGVLGYKVCDVKLFEIQRRSVYDPCCSLLLDWGRSAHATLETLVKKLNDKDMHRMDILTDLQEKWNIVQ